MRPREFNRFVAELYQAAPKADPWQPWMRGLSTLLNRDFATTSVRRRSDPPRIAGSSTKLSEGAFSSYVNYYQRRDIFSPPAWKIPARRAHLRHSIVPDDVFTKSEVYNDFYKSEGLIDCAAVAVDHQDLRMLVIVAQREGERAFGVDEVRTLSALAPHLKTAFELQNLALLAEASPTPSAPFEHLPFGFAVVSRCGRLAYANARLRSLLNEADRFCLKEGRVVPARDEQAVEFNCLVERAAGVDAMPVGGFMSVGVGGPSDRLSVTLMPLSPDAGFGTSAEDCVALLVVDPRRPGAWTTEDLQRTFGLTFSEARVAILLAAGIPTADIADRLHLRIASVRAHLKAVFVKTKTHSQVELVHGLLSAAPIAPTPTGVAD